MSEIINHIYNYFYRTFSRSGQQQVWLDKIKYYDSCIEHIPEHLLDYNFCKEVVLIYGHSLKSIPNKFKDRELCKIAALRDNGNALQFVPENILDYEFCKEIVSEYGIALQFVPSKFKDYQLCEIAVKQNKMAVLYIFDDPKT